MNHRSHEQVMMMAQVENNYLWGLCQRCEYLLSDYSLNNNHKFRKKVGENPKGFVDISIFKEDGVIGQLLKNMEIKDEQSGNIVIRRAINQYSKKLKANWMQIRRIQPYVDKIKQTRPIYVDRVPPDMPKQQILSILGIPEESVYCILKKQEGGLVYALIYCQDPEKILAHKQQINKKSLMDIGGYSLYIANKQSYMTLRNSEINPKIAYQGTYLSTYSQLKKSNNQFNQNSQQDSEDLHYAEEPNQEKWEREHPLPAHYQAELSKKQKMKQNQKVKLGLFEFDNAFWMNNDSP